MGLLRHEASGRVATLGPRTPIGRAPWCAVVVPDPRASAEHAVVTWSGRGWEIHDLGSRNGTWLDGRRLSAGDRVALDPGARLGFGAAHGAWRLLDGHAPVAAARRHEDGALRHAVSGLLALPSDEAPSATVHLGPAGWTIEVDGRADTAADQQTLLVDGAAWTLHVPAGGEPITRTVDGAAAPPLIATIELDFRVSADEEHVDVTLRTEGGAVELPPRSSHYTLLTLARARRDDAARGIATGEQGWVYAADLATMLDYTAERLNVEVYRARALLARAGVGDPARLIERRATSRQLRIGVERVHVRRA